MEEVQLELDQATLANLAVYANERDITINKAMNQILIDYIKNAESQAKNNFSEDDCKIIEATSKICIQGVNIDTLKEFGIAYRNWFESPSEYLVSELIEDGFDKADEELYPNNN